MTALNDLLLTFVALYFVAACLVVVMGAIIAGLVALGKKLLPPEKVRPAWEPQYARTARIGPWHAKFCWLPVRLEDDRWAWFRWVCRARFAWSSPGERYSGREWHRVEIAV